MSSSQCVDVISCPSPIKHEPLPPAQDSLSNFNFDWFIENMKVPEETQLDSVEESGHAFEF